MTYKLPDALQQLHEHRQTCERDRDEIEARNCHALLTEDIHNQMTALVKALNLLGFNLTADDMAVNMTDGTAFFMAGYARIEVAAELARKIATGGRPGRYIAETDQRLSFKLVVLNHTPEYPADVTPPEISYERFSWSRHYTHQDALHLKQTTVDDYPTQVKLVKAALADAILAINQNIEDQLDDWQQHLEDLRQPEQALATVIEAAITGYLAGKDLTARHVFISLSLWEAPQQAICAEIVRRLENAGFTIHHEAFLSGDNGDSQYVARFVNWHNQMTKPDESDINDPDLIAE